ncbi:hypothetical protein [Reyranella sp.]|uniref:hypothetical protein n=1 Tax=Reyranella sp. TaxID=1929291 RepID=UPI003F711114
MPMPDTDETCSTCRHLVQVDGIAFCGRNPVFPEPVTPAVDWCPKWQEIEEEEG